MSSILEALRELESDATPVRHRSIPITEAQTRRSPIVAGIVLLALVGGGALYFLKFRPAGEPPSAAPPTAAVQPPPREATTANALPPAAPATVPPAILDAEPPRAQVAAAGSAPIAQEKVTPRPVRRPPPARVALAPTDPMPRVTRRPGPPRPAGEPRVDVQGIDYVAGTGHRTATISINGDSPVILHEGETIGELDVQLILPDRVYLRHAGQIFAVDAD